MTSDEFRKMWTFELRPKRCIKCGITELPAMAYGICWACLDIWMAEMGITK